MHKLLLIVFVSISIVCVGQKENPIWLGKSNRILNPGAELNSEGAPLLWKTDFSVGAESNWVSPYGVTSHEWNHGEKKLGLPTNPGNNYFRLTVNKYEETRKINLFQIFLMAVILLLILVSVLVAGGFLLAFLWSVKTGQMDDDYTPSVRILFEDSIKVDQKEELEMLFGLNTMNTTKKFTNRLRLITVVFSLCFVVMIVGVSLLDWWFVEMTATFLVGAIIIGFIAKIKESIFVEEFAKGAASLLSVAFIVGIARGVTILMEDGLISDTILYHASTITEGLNKGVFTNFMLFIYGGLSFFMPSSSGMAVLTMPIMSPLADTVNIGRETIVDTYQYGMGLFYLINPTGLILAALAIVKIGFNKWLKFIMPLVLILLITTMVLLTISVY